MANPRPIISSIRLPPWPARAPKMTEDTTLRRCRACGEMRAPATVGQYDRAICAECNALNYDPAAAPAPARDGTRRGRPKGPQAPKAKRAAPAAKPSRKPSALEYDPATVSRPDVTPEFKTGLPTTTRKVTQRDERGRIVASTGTAVTNGSAERAAALFAPHEQLFLQRVLDIAQSENARAALQASIYGLERIHGKIPLELNSKSTQLRVDVCGALDNILVSRIGDTPVFGHGADDLQARLLALREEIDQQLSAASVIDLDALAVEAADTQEAERDEALYGDDADDTGAEPKPRIVNGMRINE